jgi:hypothetical protein
MTPFAYDALPSAQHIFTNYTGKPNPVWLFATYSVSVVTIFWARALFILGEYPTDSGYYSGAYLSTNETIISTRSTLHASGALIFVLTIQPLITLTALAVVVWLYNVPLGTGFGIISILSGFKPSESQSIAGAGLSGKLTLPLRLEVISTGPAGASSSQAVMAVSKAEVTYRLVGTSKPRQIKELQKGQTYW